MKAEINIDTQELEERISQRVVKALKPLLSDRSEETTLFTVKGLARHLQVSEKWLYERVQLKEIPYYKVGANLRFKRSEIENWLGTLKTPAANPIALPLKVAK